jgi:8-oxo-dGTP pyrophosphatase MutT (NUDIX family)
MPRLPHRMRERAESIARGLATWEAPPLRDAATVCLLREDGSGIEVFVMRRTASMAFAAGMHVYPGGAVEESDGEVPLAGRADLDDVALRTSSADARALLVAAARETFEECGVLLALTHEGAPALADDDLDADRLALVAGELTFADVLARRGLAVDDAALVPFAHWVTPEVEDRRYDTRFFMTAVPEGQQARHVEGEADQSTWWRPAEALSAYAEGSMAMLPPTLAVMNMLAACPDVATALRLAGRADVWPILPAPVLDEWGAVVWHIVHARTRAVFALGEEPPASESDGVADRVDPSAGDDV